MIKRILRSAMLVTLATSRDWEKCNRSRLIWGDRGDHLVLTPIGLINSARRVVGLNPWAI